MLLGVDDELQTDLMCGNEILKNSKIGKVLGVLTAESTLEHIC